MDKIINKINILGGLSVTAFTAIFGQYWFLFAGFLFLNMIDYFTGWAKAKFYNKNESSAVGAKGILKKVLYWFVIAIAFFISFSFIRMGNILNLNISLDFVILFGWFTLSTYFINELRSIIENLIEMDVNIPIWLIKGLDIAEKAISEKIDNTVNKNDTNL